MERQITPPPVSRKRKYSEHENVKSDPPHIPSSNPSHLTLYSWNINGLAPYLQTQNPITSYISRTSTPLPSSSPPSLRDFLAAKNWPHLLLLQEVKLLPTSTTSHRAAHRALNPPTPTSQGPRYTIHLSLPTTPHHAHTRTYGVLTAIHTSLTPYVSTVRTPTWDAEGRVLVLETTPFPAAPPLAILNIYAVNATARPHRDAAGAVSGTRHDAKRAFHANLLAEVQGLTARGFGVVMAGDMNVAAERVDGWPRLREWPVEHVGHRRDFKEKFFGVWDGVDAFRECRGGARKYSWHAAGREWGSCCDRVDYVIVSRELVEKGVLVDCDVLMREEERGRSDHVPVCGCLDVGLDKVEEGVEEEE